MAKKSVIAREKARYKKYEKYKQKRKAILMNIKAEVDPKDSWRLRLKLQKIPKNASPVRLTRRCFLTGRAHAVYSRFGLSRIKLREYAMRGQIPGIIRSSW